MAKAHLLKVMRDSGEVMPIAMVDAAGGAATDDTAAGATGIEAEAAEVAGEVAGESMPAIETEAATDAADADGAGATAVTNAETNN